MFLFHKPSVPHPNLAPNPNRFMAPMRAGERGPPLLLFHEPSVPNPNLAPNPNRFMAPMPAQKTVSAAPQPRLARNLPTIFPLPFRRWEGRSEGSALAPEFLSSQFPHRPSTTRPVLSPSDAKRAFLSWSVRNSQPTHSLAACPRPSASPGHASVLRPVVSLLFRRSFDGASTEFRRSFEGIWPFSFPLPSHPPSGTINHQLPPPIHLPFSAPPAPLALPHTIPHRSPRPNSAPLHDDRIISPPTLPDDAPIVKQKESFRGAAGASCRCHHPERMEIRQPRSLAFSNRTACPRLSLL